MLVEKIWNRVLFVKKSGIFGHNTWLKLVFCLDYRFDLIRHRFNKDSAVIWLHGFSHRVFPFCVDFG